MVEKLAKLAMLSLTEDEKKILEKDIEKILAHIDKLKKLDVDNVEPTFHPNQTYLPLRKDIPAKGIDIDDVFMNAPKRRNNFFVVKKVVSYEP